MSCFPVAMDSDLSYNEIYGKEKGRGMDSKIMRKIPIQGLTVLLILIGLAILISSCGPRPLTESQIRQLTDTAAALTVQAVSTDLAGKWTETPIPPTATRPTSTPTRTLTRTPIPPTKTSTLTPTIATEWAKCINAEFVSETIPDGAIIAPGTFFTQSWTLRNTGTCPWTSDYKMVFEFRRSDDEYYRDQISKREYCSR